jgi:hypothetical protein
VSQGVARAPRLTSDDTQRPGSLRDFLSAVQRLSKAQNDQTLILEFLQEALEVPPDEDAAASIKEAQFVVNEIIQDVETILDAIDNAKLRIKILSTVNDALLHGYILGNYSRPTSASWRMREKEILQSNVARAIKARKQKSDRVQELIERLAVDLWSQKPSFKENPTGTAKQIQGAFNSEICKWETEEIPTGWEPADLRDPIAKQKEIDRLRKRIEKIADKELADNRRSSS